MRYMIYILEFVFISTLFTGAYAQQQDDFPIGVLLFGSTDVDFHQLHNDLNLTWIQGSGGAGHGQHRAIETNSDSLYVITIREHLRELAQAQRLEIQAEDELAIPWVKAYFANTPSVIGTGVSGEGRYAQQGSAGYLVRGVRPNNEYYREGIHYVTFNMKIDKSTASPSEVAKLEIVWLKQNGTEEIISERILDDADFSDNEYHLFEVPFINPCTSSSSGKFLRGGASIASTCTQNNIDVRVYVYGNRTTWLDKVIIEDDAGHSLFPRDGQNTGANDNTILDDASELQDLTTYNKIKRLYLADEPAKSQFRSFRYISNKLNLLSLDPNSNGRCRTITATPWLDNWLQWFLQDGQPREILADYYVFTSSIPSPLINDIQATDLGIMLYHEDSESYNTALQSGLTILEARLGSSVKSLQEAGTRLWYTPQLHGEYFVNTGKYQHPDGAAALRPPTGNEIQVEINLAIAFGAKGIVGYPFGTDPVANFNNYEGQAFMTGLVSTIASSDSKFRDHSNDTAILPGPAGDKTVYTGYKEKWDSLNSINKKLKVLAPTLLSLTWQGAKSWNTNSVYSSWSDPLTSVTAKKTDGIADQVTDVLTGQFTDGSSTYLYVVNRRCDPTNGIDTRDISMTLSTTYPYGYAVDVEKNTRFLTISGASFTDRFAPGEGKLYKVFQREPLTSNSINALSTSNQRSIVRDNSNNLHMVYMSDNAIWYTKSTDEGTSWENELLISGGLPLPGVIYRNPVIISLSTGDAAVAWEEAEHQVDGWHHRINVGRCVWPGFYFTIDSEEFVTTSDVLIKPAFSSWIYSQTGEEFLDLCWKGASSIRYAMLSSPALDVIARFNVEGTTQYSFNPSVISNLYLNGSIWLDRHSFVWEEKPPTGPQTLEYAHLTNQWFHGTTPIATNGTNEQNSNPVIAVDEDNHVSIAWEYKNTAISENSIKFQKRELDFSVVQNSEKEFKLCSESISNVKNVSLSYDQNNIALVFQSSPDQLAYAYSLKNPLNGIWLWSEVANVSISGQGFSLCNKKSSTTNSWYSAVLASSTPPYQIQTIALPTTFPDLLEITTLTTPADNASGIPISNTFQWNAASGATAYTLQVALDESFSNIFGTFTNITETQKAVSGLAYSTVYYWRVQATNCPAASDWSDVRKCTTEVAMPQQITPANNATNVGTPLTLRWNSINNAVSYRIQIDNDINFTPSVFIDISGLTDTSYITNTLSQNTQYYWRVYAVNGMGATILPSIRSFTTGGVPSAPLLVTPMEEAFNVTSPVTFSWNAVSGAQTYNLFYSPDPNFEDGVSHLNNLTATSVTVGINFTGTCYWHVFAINTYGSAASDDWSFNIVSGFAAPTFNGANYTSGGITYPKLYWTRVSQATNYKLYRYYCNNSGSDCENYMQQTLIYSGNDTVVVDYSLFVGASSSNSRGYYYVKAYKADGTSSAKSSKRWYYTQLDSKTSFRPEQDDEQLPLTNRLLDNFPNPFNPTTTIYYDLAEDNHVKIVVVNTLGVEVATLVDDYVSAGYKSASFDASSLPSGVYLSRMPASA